MATENQSNPLVVTSPDGSVRNLATDVPYVAPLIDTSSQVQQLQGLTSDYLQKRQAEEQAEQRRQAEEQAQQASLAYTLQGAQMMGSTAQMMGTPAQGASGTNASGQLDFVPQAYQNGFQNWSKKTQDNYVSSIVDAVATQYGADAVNKEQYRKAIVAQFKGQPGSKVGRQLETNLLSSSVAAIMGGFTNFARGVVGIGELLTPGESTTPSMARELVDGAADYWSGFYSENQRDARMEMQEHISAGEYGATAAQILTSPGLMTSMAVDSLLPSLIGVGKVKLGLQGIKSGAGYLLGAEKATKVTNAVTKIQTSNTIGANMVKIGLPSGFVAGGATAYAMADDAGNMTTEQRLSALASIGVNALLPSIASRYAPTMESAIANGFRNTTGRSTIANAGLGVLSESVTEGIAEGFDATVQAAQGDRNNPNFNWQNVQDNKNQIIGQAVVGATLGAVTGGLAGLASGRPSEVAQPGQNPASNIGDNRSSTDPTATPPVTPTPTQGTNPAPVVDPTAVADATITPADNIDSATLEGHAYDTIVDTLNTVQERTTSNLFNDDTPLYNLEQVAQDAVAYPTATEMLQNARDQLVDIHAEIGQHPEDSTLFADSTVLSTAIQQLDQAIAEMPIVRGAQEAKAEVQGATQGVTVDTLASAYQAIDPKINGSTVYFDSIVDKLAAIAAGNTSVDRRNEILDVLAEQTGLTPEALLSYGTEVRTETWNYEQGDGTAQVPDSLGAYKNRLLNLPNSSRYFMPDNITQDNIASDYASRPKASDLAPNPLTPTDMRVNPTVTTSLQGDEAVGTVEQEAMDEAGTPNNTHTQQVSELVGPEPISENPTADFENPRGLVSNEVVRQHLREVGEIPARYMHERNWASSNGKKQAARVMAGEMELSMFLYNTVVAGVDAPSRGVLYRDYKYAGWLLDQVDAVNAVNTAQEQLTAMGNDVQVTEQSEYTQTAVEDTSVDPAPMAVEGITDTVYEPRSEYIQSIFDLVPDTETSVLLGQASLLNSELYSSTRAMLEGYEYDARQADQLMRSSAMIIDDVIAGNPDLNNEQMARTLINYTIQRTGLAQVDKAWSSRMEIAENAIKDAARDLANAEAWASHTNEQSHIVVQYQTLVEQARANADNITAQKPRDYAPSDAEAVIPDHIRQIIGDKINEQMVQETPLTVLQAIAKIADLTPAERRVRSDIPGAKVPDLNAFYTALIHGDENAKATVTAQMERDIRSLYTDARLPQLHATAAIADIHQQVRAYAERELDAMDLTTFDETKVEMLSNIADTVDHSMWTMLFDTVSNGQRPLAHYLTSDFWTSGVASTRMSQFDMQTEPDPLDLYNALRDVYEVTRTEPEFTQDAYTAKVAMQVLRTADNEFSSRTDNGNYLPAGPVPTTIPYLSQVDNTLGGYVRANDVAGALDHISKQFGENQLVEILMRLYRESPVQINIDITGNPQLVGGQMRTSHYDPTSLTVQYSNGAETIPYNVVHETLHAMTHFLMTTDASNLTADQILARDAINELYAEAQQRSAVVVYATNVHEFVAEAFSNPAQRTLLEAYASGVQGLARIRSAWQGFTSFVRRLFGLTPGQHNALTDLMASTKTLLSPKPRAQNSMGTGGASVTGQRILRNTTNRQPVASVIYRRGSDRPMAVIYQNTNAPGFTAMTLDGTAPDKAFNTYADAANSYARDAGYQIKDVALSDRLVGDARNTQSLRGDEGMGPQLKLISKMIRRMFRVRDGDLIDRAILRMLNSTRVAKSSAMERFAILQELGRITGDPIYETARVEIGQARADVGRYMGTTNVIARDVNTALKKVKGTVDEFGNFMYALHVAERNHAYAGKTAPGYTIPMDDVTGFTYTDQTGQEVRGTPGAKAFLDNLPAEKKVVYQKLADKIQDIQRDSLTQQWQAGMLDYGSYLALGGRDSNGNIATDAYKWYVPLLNKDRDSTVARYGISGRTSHADNPFLALLEQMQQTRFRMANNNVGNALIDMLLKTPIPQFASVDTVKIVRNKEGEISLKDNRDDDGVLYVMRDGQMHRVIFNDKTAMGKAGAKAFDRTGDINAVTAAMTHVTSVMSALNTTASPAFMLKSYTWALGTLLFNTQSAFDGRLNMAQSYALAAKSIPSIAKYTAMSTWFTASRKDPTPLLTLYQQLGGGIAGTNFAGMDTVQRRLGTSWADWGEGVGHGKLTMMDITQGTTGKALHVVHEFMNSPEDAVRFSVFKGFIEQQAGQTFNDDAQGANAMQAWLIANPDIARTAILGSKRLTGDFEAKGTNQFLRGYFMFWNAGMQGSRMFANALSTPQGLTSFGLLMLAGSAVAISRMDDPADEDKDGMSVYGRNRDRSTSLRINDEFQIPLPYEARLAYNIGSTQALLSAGKINPSEALTSLITTTRELFVPLPYGGTGDRGTDLGLMLLPSFSMPAVTGLFGIDHFRENVDGKGIYILAPGKDGALTPTYVADPMNHEKINYKTSDLSRKIANASYDHLGLDMSPRRIDAAVGSFFGGASTFLKDTGRPDYESPVGFGGGVMGAVTKPFRPAEDQTGFAISKDYQALQSRVASAGRRDSLGLNSDSQDILNLSANSAQAKKIDEALKKQTGSLTVGGQKAGYYIAVRDAAARAGDEETMKGAIASLNDLNVQRDQVTAKAVMELRALLGTEE